MHAAMRWVPPRRCCCLCVCCSNTGVVDGDGRPVFLFLAARFAVSSIPPSQLLLLIIRSLEEASARAYTVVYCHTACGMSPACVLLILTFSPPFPPSLSPHCHLFQGCRTCLHPKWSKTFTIHSQDRKHPRALYHLPSQSAEHWRAFPACSPLQRLNNFACNLRSRLVSSFCSSASHYFVTRPPDSKRTSRHCMCCTAAGRSRCRCRLSHFASRYVPSPHFDAVRPRV